VSPRAKTDIRTQRTQRSTKDAKETEDQFWFSFCALCETFASSASGCPLPNQARLRAVTSISIFIRGSASPAEIIIAAGLDSPKYLRSTGQQAGKSSDLGST